MKKHFRLLGILFLMVAFNTSLLVGYAPKKAISVPSKTKAKAKITAKSKPTVTKKTIKAKPAKKQVSNKTNPTPKTPKNSTTTSAIQLNNGSSGLLWKITKDKATVYLFGSVHISKPDMFPFKKSVEDAFNSSNNLVVEANINDTASVLKSQSKLVYSSDDNLYNHITPEGKAKVDELVKQFGLNEPGVKTLKLWVLDSTLLSLISGQLGYGPGVDSYFLTKAADGKKKISELEGIDFQFDLLNGFSDTIQEKLFLNDISDINNAGASLDKLCNAYKIGDEATLTHLLIDDIKSAPEEYIKALYTDRNKGMADKIDGYLNTEDTYFVVAGSAHFLGEGSVIDLLKQKGYEITKIK